MNKIYYAVILFSLNISFLFSQTYSGGKVDDGQVHTPPVYSGFTAPAKGTTYQDAYYETKITRLSNGQNDFSDAVHHEYSPINSFNSNSTYILLNRDMGAFFVVDKQGNIIVTNNELNLSNSSEPRWSKNNPDLFYYHDYNSNQIKSFTVSTKQSAVVKTFSQYSKITFGGGGDSDLSFDGDHIVICGDERYIGVYTFSTSSLGTTLDTQGLGSGFAFFDITADNNVVCRWYDYGTGRYKGFELFDKEMNFIRQVHKYGAHSDFGRDADGDEVLVVCAYSDLNPPSGCENNGVEVVKLKDGSHKCVIGFNWESELHVSMNSQGPWLVVDEIATGCSCTNPDNTLPNNWQNGWKQYSNEIVLVKADGSEIRRIAHHQSRNFSGCYWCQPRASLSQDGKYLLFDSNHGINPTGDYSDVFLADLGLTLSTGNATTLASVNNFEFSISNNPTNNFFTLHISNPDNSYIEMKIMTTEGKLVEQKVIGTANQLYHRYEKQLAAGNYIIQVNNGKTSRFQHLIITQ